MKHLNPALERLEERVAPCLSLAIGLPSIGINLGACGSGNPDGCSGSSARSCDGSSASGSRSSKSKSHESGSS
jgi:hypothetical protein